MRSTSGRSRVAEDGPSGAGTGADIGRFLQQSSIYAIGSILNRVGVFLLLPVYTTYLTVSQYGQLEMFYAIAAVVGGVLSVGLAHATLRFYFEYDDLGDRNEVVSTNLVAATVIAALGALLVMPFREALSGFVFGAPGHEVGIAIVLTTMVLEMSTQIGLAYLRARENAVLFLAVVLLRLLVQVSVNTWLVVAMGAGVTGVLTGNCIAVAAGWAVLTVYTVRRCGLKFRVQKAVPILRYSYPFLLSMMVGVAAANADRIFIRTLLSFEALGLFALATKFSKLLEELIGVPFSHAYGSFRFSVMHQSNAAEVQARITRLLFAVAVTAGLGVLFFAGDVLAVMSSESFRGASRLLPILVVAAVARVMTYPMQTAILVRKRTREIFFLNLFGAVLYIASSYLLTRSFGLIGASVAMLVAAVGVLWATDRVAQRHLRVQYGFGSWIQVVLLSACCYAAALPLLHAPLWLGVPLKLALLSLFAAALAGSKVFADEERAMAVAWVQGLPLRWTARRGELAAARDGGM